jgi:hypothetical protein
MSGLISANSSQGKLSFPARIFCSGRIVLLPEADAPLTFITTGFLCGGNAR